MHAYVSISASLLSLGLISLLYVSITRAGPASPLRDQTVSMVLVCVFLGVLTMAVSSTGSATWDIFESGLDLSDSTKAALDLAAIAALVLTLLVFRAAVIAAAADRARDETSVEPQPPHPMAPPRHHGPTDRAA